MNRAAKEVGLNGLQRVLLCLILVGGAWLATVAPNPPAPLPADASMNDFSAERALAHVRAVAQTPRPIGSEANAAARDYITSQLKALGLEVEAQPFPVRIQNRDLTGVNLIARIPGSRQPKGHALALVCHHDTVPAGPGASDDGAGVATLLETARALKAGSSPENDVVLLFTDGEESTDLEGARAFVNSPRAKEIALVLNFEARGVSGPVFMFETSNGNKPLIREFGKFAPRPVANSLMYEVYRRMPNDTDFTIFRGAGVAGLNFAFIGDPQHYHRATDDLAHLSPSSLQHAGTYALSLSRHFGNLSLQNLTDGDAVYFDLFGRFLVRYPSSWAFFLAIIAAALFGGVTIATIRRRIASPIQLALAVVISAVQLLIIGAIFRYGSEIVFKAGLPASFFGWPFWFAAVALTLTFYIVFHIVLRRWLAPANLALGSLCWWLILAISSAVWMPGTSYLFLWPLLLALVGILTTTSAQNSWRCLMWLALTALPAVILVSPLINKFYVALGPQAILVPMVVLALQLGALTSEIDAIFAGRTHRELNASPTCATLPPHASQSD